MKLKFESKQPGRRDNAKVTVVDGNKLLENLLEGVQSIKLTYNKDEQNTKAYIEIENVEFEFDTIFDKDFKIVERETIPSDRSFEIVASVNGNTTIYYTD